MIKSIIYSWWWVLIDHIVIIYTAIVYAHSQCIIFFPSKEDRMIVFTYARLDTDF